LTPKRAEGWLRTLTVEGFGLIDRTAVELRPGLNAFTGETGSGKSMVLDALGFAFGDRAGADVVRSGSAKAAVFVEVEPIAAARGWLADNGFESEDDALIVSREVTAQGRSSARVNGKPATAGQLRELGDLLLDVVGQNEHARLSQPSRHLDLLDEFGGEKAAQARAVSASLYARAKELSAGLTKLKASEAAAGRALADARYAADEIAAARLRPGEIEELRERRTLLANSARISLALRSASEAIDFADAGATAMLGRAAAALEPIAEFGAALSDLREQAKGLQSAAQDLGVAIASLADDDGGDPAQLDGVEDRLALIDALRKKYGPTVEEITAAGAKFGEQAQALEQRDEEIARLEVSLSTCENELQLAAAALTAQRKAAASDLNARVCAELNALGMRGASFRCDVASAGDAIGPSGADRVEFYASLNPNEPERAIAKAASGGELSRLLLALKVALADVDPHPIVILDEIDAGIGGAAARAVGARIAALARSVQVLCVTHLAQIAVFADEHVALTKTVAKGRGSIQARVLADRDEKTTEIARMLSGDAHGAEALKHAEALLREVRGSAAR
jgi:DNA repair protein RecN (Recombination protein N)